MTPHFLPRAKKTPFIARHTRNVESDFVQNNTRVIPTVFRRMSQYWIPKCFMANPSTEVSTSYFSM